jgi:ATP-dependent Zn protease
MKENAAKGYKKTKPKQTQFLQRPKMNTNLYVIEGYENETAFRPKKTNPNKPNFFSSNYANRMLLFCYCFVLFLIFFNTSQNEIPKRLNWLMIFGEECARSFCITAVDIPKRII